MGYCDPYKFIWGWTRDPENKYIVLCPYIMTEFAKERISNMISYYTQLQHLGLL